MEVSELLGGTSRGTLFAGGCILVAVVGLLLPSRAPAPIASASAALTQGIATEKSEVSGWAAGAEPRVTFAYTMPRGRGAQSITNTGAPDPTLVTVAIPDGPKAVRFVRGTHPDAIRYLAETKAAQERLTVDNGPTNVDTSEMTNFGPLKGRATRRVALGSGPK